jgi:Spy/CpxP family protein refolding chaperone
MAQMAPHRGDRQKLASLTKAGRQQLEAMWQRERDDRQRQSARRGDGFAAERPDDV